jgi:hypothetical protein
VTVAERAVQMWPILVLAARNRQTLTYQIVEQSTGMMAPGVGKCLDPIQSYCRVHKLPPLTVLVVGKDDGMPGTGFSAAADVPMAQAEVYKHDWTVNRCPSREEFEQVARDDKDSRV